MSPRKAKPPGFNPAQLLAKSIGDDILRLTVPMPPNLTNRASGKSHWRTIQREHDTYFTLLDMRLTIGMIPDPPRVPIDPPLISSTMYLGAQMDQDNAMARHKWLIDWLSKRGFIGNDRRARWAAFPHQVVKRGQDYRIELAIRHQVTLECTHC